MHIGIFTSRALPRIGGLEVVVDQLARGFTSLGHRVTVVAPRPKWWAFPDDSQFPYQILRYPPFVSKRYLVQWHLRYFRDIISQMNFDIIHCHDIYPQAYLCSESDSCATPIVLTSHGSDVMPQLLVSTTGSVRDKTILTSSKIAAFVACSPSMLTQFNALSSSPNNTALIANGVDFDGLSETVALPACFPSLVDRGKYILFLGRLTKRKALDCLLRALAMLPPEKRLPLIVAGYGREMRQLKKLALSLSIAKDVFFIGAVTGKAKAFLLQNCLMSVVPTRTWEACSLVVLESFAAQAAVIASDVPGISDLIMDRSNGLLVAPDDPQQLSRAITELAENKQLRQELAEAGRASAKSHNWPIITQCYLELFRSLLNESKLEKIRA